ncbi:uncharacterized protein PV09_00435 [Verruconis gallopava]|uniref:RING-type domain-containing protein n=1 Tax=Verruconis gallopava TaxID=253628 RepID=A0A0D1Z9C6_9PEZI|nr:uncharacterized protein PV09_00435 [Verruconis gallopava]KIW09562.1 hypothetical protein PV09_00435 [Verruconis gallopava]
MSATASFSNAEPPPLLFGSPPFSPRSPLHTQTPASPPPLAMEEPEDTDMTTSITLPAQNHDRQDHTMEDGGEAAQAALGEAGLGNSNSDRDAVVEDALDDAMDTTPDSSPQPEDQPSQPGLQQARSTPGPHDNDPPTASAALAARGDSPPHLESPHTPRHGVAEDDAVAIEPSQPPSAPASASLPPPMTGNEEDDDSSSVSSEEDPLQWHEIIEDTSVPDEDELKEIEAMTEHSALDDEYWRRRTFAPLHDPEYTPGPSGSIRWTIERLNGTREEPNLELLLESESVQIGDYRFRLKLYPNSINESRYLSVFLSCDTMAELKPSKPHELLPKPRKKKSKERNKTAKSKESSTTDAQADASSSSSRQEPKQEWQHTPLPLLDPKRIPKRPSVAAQFSIIMYNPEEPRTHYHMTFSHRFCPGAPDHGTPHFGFSKADAAIRRRQQRQAIYRNDKLAFVTHIRLINDDTGCLWERSNRENPYDSLMITGLQGISSRGFGMSGGNVISAISTWLLLMPFRQLLYEAKAPNPVTESRERPKPMLLALQKILYCLRTRPEGVGNGPFALEDLLDAFEWYAMDKTTDKYDTIEIWEIIRSKLEEELRGTPHENRLAQLFGPMRNRMTGVPCYKVPVKGSETMQKAIDKTSNLVDVNSDPPEVLTLELERYVFDEKKRAWHKLSERLSLDESVVVCGQEYRLFGFIVHKEHAQSGYYHSVMRPDGPKGKWYMYTDNKDDNKVMCLTRKLAVTDHEGTNPKHPNNEQAHVAYVVTYVRGDVAEWAFNVENEPEWNVPDWLVEDVKHERALAHDVACGSSFEVPGAIIANLAAAESTDKAKTRDIPKAEAKDYEFSVISSKAFEGYEGPGTIDLYDSKWNNSPHVFKVVLSGQADAVEARNQIAAAVEGVKSPHQCKVWIIGSLDGTLWRPNLITTGRKDISGGNTNSDINWTVDELVLRAPERRLWLHVVDEKDLPPQPPSHKTLQAGSRDVSSADGPSSNQEAPSMTANSTSSTIVADLESALNRPPVVSAAASEDTPMEGTVMPDQSEHVEAPLDNALPLAPPGTAADPSPLLLNVDADMGDVSALPSMPSGDLPDTITIDRSTGLPVVNLPPPIHVAVPPVADQIYFFLKTFDPKTQKLKAYGSYFVERRSRVDKTIYKIMGVDKNEKRLQFYEETDISSARKLHTHRDFSQEDLTNGSIIVAQFELKDAEKEALASRGLFTDPDAYLRALNEERTFRHTANGRFKMDYFSAEFYEGDMRYHIPHGQGRKIDHHSNSYTGSFVMGKRHGYGSMIYANGDTYEGQWVQDLQDGQGTSVELETGNKYVGGWKDGKKHGEGITYWKMAQDEGRCCRICWYNEADMVFVDCGHVVACKECSREVRDCPVCRRGIHKAIKLYLSA